MNNTKKIVAFVVVLIGGTLGFAYWSIHNFNLAFSSFDKLQETNLSNVISAETLPTVTGTTTAETVLATSTEPVNSEEFKFIFPAKATDVYSGCKYEVSWTSSSIDSIDLSLVDAGTREVMGPIAGGIPKNITGQNLESFGWKVGSVWPGKYYILVTNINGTEIQKKSATVNIIDIPETVEDIEKFCSEQIQ
jgi:hypothetical protein